MYSVGIIANPAASKDIRRLVSQGRVIPDWEKVNIVRRALLGIQSTGISDVVVMPDSAGLCIRASDDPQINLRIHTLDMPSYYVEGDTTRAAEIMQSQEVGCLVTLGGDGTNRAVAKGSCTIPIVPISTGTNNVFPSMIEGTLAGIAAGLVSAGQVCLSEISTISKAIHIYVDDFPRDISLIDVAFSRERFIGTKAIWDLSTLYEVFLTRSEPCSIGLSSIGARLKPISNDDEKGLRYVLSHENNLEVITNDLKIKAPIAPGMVSDVYISNWEIIPMDQPIDLPKKYYTVALDGERSFSVSESEKITICLRRDGPPIVDVESVLKKACEMGILAV